MDVDGPLCRAVKGTSGYTHYSQGLVGRQQRLEFRRSTFLLAFFSANGFNRSSRMYASQIRPEFTLERLVRERQTHGYTPKTAARCCIRFETELATTKTGVGCTAFGEYPPPEGRYPRASALAHVSFMPPRPTGRRMLAQRCAFLERSGSLNGRARAWTPRAHRPFSTAAVSISKQYK